jgi:hypothetical protein
VFIKIVLPLFVLGLFNLFYYTSLQTCASDLGIKECLDWVRAAIVRLVGFMILASVCSFALLMLVLKRVIHWAWPFLLAGNMMIYFFTNYDVSLDDHGYFNFWICIGSFVFMIVSFFIFKFLYFICRKSWIGRI